MHAKKLPVLPIEDLNSIFSAFSESDWAYFSQKRVFISGGSGFIGKWLVSALLTANRRLSLKCRIELLSRHPHRFIELAPHIACAEEIILHQGDVRDFAFPSGEFDIVIHAATDVEAETSPMETYATCADGTRRILRFASQSGAKDFLLTSSGAVYGKHPAIPSGYAESCGSGPYTLSPSSAYGLGKRVSEWLTCTIAAESDLRVKIARIYAQVGPYLPMNKQFAIGNFINDALAGRKIIIKGDGTPVRSYLHVSDTVIWLLSMILRGEPGRAWNLGGSESISIAGLANRVADLIGSRQGISILTPADPRSPIECYVPNTTRAYAELRLPTPIPLDDAIMRTAQWTLNNRQFS